MLHISILSFQCCTSSLIIWTVYCIIIGAFFTTLKIINVKLHKMFDVGDYCEESSDESGKSDDIETGAAILPETTLKK